MPTEIVALPGDVTDSWHRSALIEAAGARIDLLANNASLLGPSPQPALADYPLAELERVYAANAIAPLALAQLALPRLAAGAAILNVTSDAAAEPYAGWGGYGSSKAALEQLSAILGAEQPDVRVYAVDPGDMRTRMHQDAFPGEDITDRPPPAASVPGLLALIEGELRAAATGSTTCCLPPRCLAPKCLAPWSRRGVSSPAFVLPPELEAAEPPERRGVARDEVRLMVVARGSGEIVHASFRDLPGFLDPGDLVVINNSATLPAAVPARLAGRGAEAELRFASPAPGMDGARWWVVEVRSADGAEPHGAPVRGRVELPGGATATIVAPYAGGERLWLASVRVREPVDEYLLRYGHPIRYGYVPDEHPLPAYQTAYALVPGSAEMPSAGRPFTPRLVTALVARGIQIAPVTLHAGVSSPERSEAPVAERFEVPGADRPPGHGDPRLGRAGGRCRHHRRAGARDRGSARRHRGRARGWTSEVITPRRGLRAVDGLVTGWHEPEASHLHLLEASLGAELLARTYDAALDHGYLWHEFGDAQLVLP